MESRGGEAAAGPKTDTGALTQGAQAVVDVFDGFGTQLIVSWRTLTWLVRPPYRVGELLRAMDFIGAQSLFIVSLTALFSGAVLALQTATAMRQYNQEAIVGYLVATSLTQEISPVFAGLMVTARAGSSMAAELGNMRVTEQIDALTTMGVSPVQYLLAPRLLASVLVLPLLCVLYTCVGMAGAWLVAVGQLDVDPGLFLYNIETYMVPRDFWMGIAKSAVFGFLIATIAGRHGFHASGGAKGVGTATTRAVVHGAVSILVANFIVTSLFL